MTTHRLGLTMDDELDRRLNRGMLHRDEDLSTPAIDEALAMVQTQVTSHGGRAARPARSRRRRLTLGVVAAGVAAGVFVVPAAADWINPPLHTGEYEAGHDGEPEWELWRMNGKGADTRVRQFAKEYGFAPGYSVEPLVAVMHQDAQTTKVGFRRQVNFWAGCTWTLTWAEAHSKGNTQEEKRAVRWLQQDARNAPKLYEGTDTNAPEIAHKTAADAAHGRTTWIELLNRNSCGGVDRS